MLANNPHGWGNAPPIPHPVQEQEPWNFPGEARNLPDRPSDPVETPLAESLSPTMGAYGAGQTLGESLNKFAQGDLKGSAETALPLLLGIFAGPGARTADMSMLARAKELAASGALREQIWGDTGWFQGPDQKWRFEIDDNKSRIPDSRVKDLYGNWEARGSAMRSGIEHPEFFDAYPEAKALSYRYTLNPTDTGGSGEFKSNTHLGGAGEAYPGGEGLIDAEASSPSDIHKIALHELMHYVQGKEGFSGGANPVDITRGYKSLLNDYNSQIGTINDSLQQAAGTPRYNELLDMRQHLVDEVHKIEGPFGVGAKEKGFDEYRREAGEVEARNVPGRLGLPFEGRPPPWETQDTPDIDQLLASRGSSSPMSAKSPTPPYPGDAQPDWAHWGVNAGKPTPMGDGTHLPLLNEQEAPIGSINYRDTPDGVFIDGAIGGKRDGIQGQASRAIKALMEHGAATGRPVTATATGGAGNFWNIMGFRREGHDSVFDADQLAKLQSGEINSTIWGHPRGYGDTFASTYGPGAEALRAAPDKR